VLADDGRKMGRLTQYGKIVTLMCREKDRWFYPFAFMTPELGNLFVGYKAPTRIAELQHDYPLMFLNKTVDKYVVRKLNVERIDDWFPDIAKPLKCIVARELNYYPYKPEEN